MSPENARPTCLRPTAVTPLHAYICTSRTSQRRGRRFPEETSSSEKYQKTSVAPIKYFYHLFLLVCLYDTLADKMRAQSEKIILAKLDRLEYVYVVVLQLLLSNRLINIQTNIYQDVWPKVSLYVVCNMRVR